VRRGGKANLILSHQRETIFKENGELIHGLFPVECSTPQSAVMLRSARKISFVAASSLGNDCVS
jgi:hypothetical protein